jgi:hypothetical protein
VRAELAALEQDFAALPPEDFAIRYRDMLVRIQNDLGSQGFAPVASHDTMIADHNRQPLVASQWPRCA